MLERFEARAMTPSNEMINFQQFVWESLPVRKEVAGREIVDDLITVLVQLWPAEFLAACERGSTGDSVCMESLAKDSERLLTVIYGDDRYRVMWMLAMNVMTHKAINLMNDWWRRRKGNRVKLEEWRKNWVTE